jgi:MFS family permease
MAIYFCAMYLLGGAFGPLLTGKLSDHFALRAMAAVGGGAVNAAARATGLHSAMYIVPLCVLGVAVVLFAAAGTVTRDMGELQNWMAGPEAGRGAARVSGIGGGAAESA